MIAKQTMFCTECNQEVTALVESRATRKSKAAGTPLSCERARECARTTFCRFVNPLTTRNPLTSLESPERVG